MTLIRQANTGTRRYIGVTASGVVTNGSRHSLDSSKVLVIGGDDLRDVATNDLSLVEPLGGS